MGKVYDLNTELIRIAKIEKEKKSGKVVFTYGAGSFNPRKNGRTINWLTGFPDANLKYYGAREKSSGMNVRFSGRIANAY